MNYYSRKFLNAKEGVAAIECAANMSSTCCDVNTRISDCNKTVNLEFDFNTIKKYKEKRAKLALLINELNALLTAIDTKMEDPEFRKGMK